MRFEKNFALSYQITAFLLLKLAYGQILDLNEMLQLATVYLSVSFSITPLNASEETHAANCMLCVVGYLQAALSKLNASDVLLPHEATCHGTTRLTSGEIFSSFHL